MTVIDQLQITKTPFPGYTDPSLPSGTWRAQHFAVGDASGGLLEVDLVFSPASSPFDSQYYSVEELWSTHTAEAVDNADSFIINMQFTLNRALSHLMLRNANDTEIHFRGGEIVSLPWFLGQQLNPNTTSLLGFRVANALAEVLTFTATGYYWSVRSSNAPGGPSRPVQGMFPR